MKRGTVTSLQVAHELDLSTVEKIEFLFKQEKDENAPALVRKTYLPNGAGDVAEESGVFQIPFTKEETRRFSSGKSFYCDPRIVLMGGKIPNTEILAIYCTATLWGEADD